MTSLIIVLGTFAGIGLVLCLLDIMAYCNDPTPSLYSFSIGTWGLGAFIMFGLLALAVAAS